MTSTAAPIENKALEHQEFQANRIILISGGHFVHDTFTAFIAPLLPLLIDKLGLTLVLAGSLSAFLQLPTFLSPLIGYAADRFTVRYLVIFAPAVTATLATLIGFMPSYATTTLLLFAAGVSVMCFHAPAPAMIAHISGNKIGRGLSFFMAGGELGRTLGPLMVGFGVAQWGIEGLWRLMFFGWLATLILYFRLRDVSAKRDRSRSISKTPIKRFLRVFAPLFGVMAFRDMISNSLMVFMVVYLVDIRGFGLILATGALALYQLAGVIGALAGGTLSDRFGRRKTVALGDDNFRAIHAGFCTSRRPAFDPGIAGAGRNLIGCGAGVPGAGARSDAGQPGYGKRRIHIVRLYCTRQQCHHCGPSGRCAGLADGIRRHRAHYSGFLAFDHDPAGCACNSA